MKNRSHFIARLLIIFVLLVSMGCNLTNPNVAPTEQALFTPTPSAPLPPGIAETYPLNGSQIALNGTLTIYFNQPMDRASVESALQFVPTDFSPRLTWSDSATLILAPKDILQPASALNVTINTNARAANGLALEKDFVLDFTTADALRLTQMLPAPNAENVTPLSAVVASFNQPVVPLNGEIADQPAAFTLDPSAQGHGEWINTSTYIFYPETGLGGGEAYTVTLNARLTSVGGSSLAADQSQSSWSFTTSLPEVVSIEPITEGDIALDSTFKIFFNQPMDRGTVEAAFKLTGNEGKATAGSFSWDERGMELTFKPNALLERDLVYSLRIDESARNLGGTFITAPAEQAYHTYGNFAVQTTKPEQNGVKSINDSLAIIFNAPVDLKNDPSLVTIKPDVPDFSTYVYENTVSIYGTFTPETSYTVTVSPQFGDAWGQKLGKAFTYKFQTPRAQSNLQLPYFSQNTYAVSAENPVIMAQAVNINTIQSWIAPIPFNDYVSLTGANGFELQKTYQAAGLVSRERAITLEPNKAGVVDIDLLYGIDSLATGVYYLWLQTPEMTGEANTLAHPFFVVASHTNVTFKFGTSDALVWVVDARTNAPIANAPVRVYDDKGTLIASGITNADGIWAAPIPAQTEQFANFYALVGDPGADNFGLAVSTWSDAVAPWDFGLRADYGGSHHQVYLYSDRPIYKPGQTVYFRGVAREAFYGAYSLFPFKEIPLTLSDSEGRELEKFNLTLSEFGTFNGEYTLPESAVPGYYNLTNSDLELYFYFQVADYRKPEINLGVEMIPQKEARAGQAIQAVINANYFFGAPVGDLKLHWRLYANPQDFYLPQYTIGLWDTTWMRNGFGQFGGFGEFIAEGDAVTGANGAHFLTLPSIDSKFNGVTLEVTAQEESGLPVSARASITIHPESFYIGIRPQQYVGSANSDMTFDILTTDWTKNPSGNRALKADFKYVTWKRTDTTYTASYAPVYTDAGTKTITTDPDGKAQVAFKPTKPGTYMLEVSSANARTQILVWVGGADQVAWINLPDQHLQLSADKDNYAPGETAKIFIPNPFDTDATALITVERGTILHSQIARLSGSGTSVSIPLDDLSAPNVFISATVLGAENDFRQGYLQLDVEPRAQTLRVELTSTPERTSPRGDVKFNIRVTDSNGLPVRGEFSLAVVDLAALSLADPNSLDIVTEFYGEKPLGIRSGFSMAVNGQRAIKPRAGGGGGGGDGSALFVRENFPDTAYWNATIITDADGRAEVNIKLPDTLTTWRVDLRGLTEDTRVGQAQSDIITSKDLIVRPAAPRFFVMGDHVQLNTLVNNNTGAQVQATVNLQASGFVLDDASLATQVVQIPANGRAEVSWWGVTANVTEIELTISAQTSGAQDAVKLSDLPVLHYSAPQTFSTAGMLYEKGSFTEYISLPRSYSATNGKLDIELSPSLAAQILSALQVYDLPEKTWSNEQVVSSFLPNLAVYQALNTAGLQLPELQTKLNATLAESVLRLSGAQNADGGWGWSNGGESDPMTSAYVLFGLQRAKSFGIDVTQDTINRAREYLVSARPYLGGGDTPAWALERAAFSLYVLKETGAVEEPSIQALYNTRDQLSPWAQAFLALSMPENDERANTILSNLQTTALRTSTSLHWESKSNEWQNPSTPLYTSAIVVYALAKRNTAALEVGDAVRYLSAQRNAAGTWGSPYESAWVMLALNEAMRTSGDLQANFDFSADLNNATVSAGKALAPQTLSPVNVSAPLNLLNLTAPNILTFNHGEGNGRLYYRAALTLDRPAESAAPLNAGMSISRAYYDANCKQNCPALTAFTMSETKRIKAQVTITVPHDSYYVIVEDFIPAGAEILNTALKTSEQGEGDGTTIEYFDPENPFELGWGWWLFRSPAIYDNRITWSVDQLPAGTYTLTYTIIPLQAGQFRVLPAHVYQYFFPEVQGTSAGSVFEIKR